MPAGTEPFNLLILDADNFFLNIFVTAEIIHCFWWQLSLETRNHCWLNKQYDTVQYNTGRKILRLVDKAVA